MVNFKNINKTRMKNITNIESLLFNFIKRKYLKKLVFISILCVLNQVNILAQDSIFIHGVVLTGLNKPLANASVSIEGSPQLPVITNEAGEFSLKCLTGNEWLVISPAADYKTKRILINKATEFKVILTSNDLFYEDDDITLLSEKVKRKNMISAHTELNLNKIPKSSALSIEHYLQGMVPGVHITSSSGMPGSIAYANIRGINSIHATNQPLYIVDGFPIMPQGTFASKLVGYDYNPLASINPSDISKVVVLKDPVSTSVYGTNGANGVIIIETLDPQATQTTIDLSLQSGFSLAPSNQIPQLNGKQHKALMHEVLFSSGKLEEDIRKEYPSLFYTEADQGFIDYQHNTNWQDIIFANSQFNNFNCKLKGVDEIARYGVSFSHTNSNGIIKNTKYKYTSLRIVSRIKVFKWLKMDASVALNYGESKLKESAVIEQTSPILASLAKSPLLNKYKYDLEGNEIGELAEVDKIGVSNPLAIIENYSAVNNNYNFIASADFESELTREFSLKSKIGLTYNVLKEQIYWPTKGMETYYDREAINVAKGSNNDIQTFYNNTSANFHKNIDNRHFITSSTGMNIQINSFEFDYGLSKNASDNDKYRFFQHGQRNLWEIGGQNRKWNWMSFYENVFYSFKDKYMFSGTVNMDMSSRLGKKADNTFNVNGVPFGLFYSYGLAWRISKDFLNDISWIDDLKVRYSYGKTGNSDIGESSAANYYKAIRYRTTVGLFPYVVPNEKLTFETVKQENWGMDISMWGNRFTVNFDIYTSKTDNMLIYSPIEVYHGYEYKAENGGSLKNTGWDLGTFFRFIDNKSFKWDVMTSVSVVKNEITYLKGGKQVTPVDGAEIVNRVGAPANSFYGYKFKGVFASQEEADLYALKNSKNLAFGPGDAIFEDISGPNGRPDSVINDYDKTNIGSSLPDLQGGIINNFTYKRWSLSTFVQFVLGNDVFNYVRYKNERMVDLSNQSQNTLNRWQYEGQITNVPRALWNDPIGNSAFSTRWLEDGSYIRIKNITLKYSIPNQFLTFRNGEIYVSAINLFTFSKYLGYDPEFASSFSQMNQGIDYGLTPQARQFIVGIKLGL
jgi:TonB-linked SusC/RagA family outer membrane protein